jgi:GNAT superfamily N-acetyltransferase
MAEESPSRAGSTCQRRGRRGTDAAPTAGRAGQLPSLTMTQDMAIKVRAFETEDEPGVLEVLRAAFGTWPRDIDSVTPTEFFHWKHMASPFGQSLMRVAVADRAVVGFGAYMPWRLRARGGALSAMRGVDFAVHPSYRGRGASSSIRATMNFPDEAALTWSNPDKESRSSGLKEGWHLVNKLPRFVQPRGQLRETMRRARARSSKTPQHLEIEAETAAEILRDGTQVSSLVSHANEPGDRLVTAKDLAYLRWRYGRLEEYRATRADPGPGRGIVIFRVRRRGPFWISDICELFVEQNDHRTVRHLLRRVRAAAAVDFLVGSFTSRREAARSGFVQLPGGTELRTRSLHEDLIPDPTRRTSWALSRGDLELL